jgi:transcription elongation factor Elf1
VTTHYRTFPPPSTRLTVYITDLSAPVDVYYDWVDAADQVAKDHADGRLEDVERVAPSALARQKAAGPSGSGYVEKNKGDGFVVDEDDDAEGDFADDDE